MMLEITNLLCKESQVMQCQSVAFLIKLDVFPARCAVKPVNIVQEKCKPFLALVSVKSGLLN